MQGVPAGSPPGSHPPPVVTRGCSPGGAEAEEDEARQLEGGELCPGGASRGKSGVGRGGGGSRGESGG